MVADRTKATSELKVAARAQIALPEKTGATHNALKQRLPQLKGDAFDQGSRRWFLTVLNACAEPA